MKPILTTYLEWLIKKNAEHALRIVQLDDDRFPVKNRDAAYVKLDENIRAAKTRFTALETIESLEEDESNMVPIILRHLSYVSCLLGNNRPKDTPPPPTLDPATISLFEEPLPISTIDLSIAAVIESAVSRCPASIHTFLPPCIHQRPILEREAPSAIARFCATTSRASPSPPSAILPAAVVSSASLVSSTRTHQRPVHQPVAVLDDALFDISQFYL
jgi:hypothetical protein